MRTPRERRHERTRDAILSAAIEMITREGADKLSLRKIAQRLDYSPAGLYEYFGSKEEIIDAVCSEGNTRLVNAMKQVPASLPLEQYLVALGLAYVTFARQNPDYFAFMFMNRAIPPEAMPGSADDLPDDDGFTVLIQAVERGQQAGLLTRSGTSLETAYSLWALVHGMATLQATYLRHVPFDFAAADQRAMESFVAGLMRE
ncbi:MAG: TetR/AcrR family transcriptional regulator [Anaerolineae bacterium]|nr:TetR/AcrR family transcriptional regulator [Anaerolineae bacterium]